MMPLGAPSISKYGSLVWPDVQKVALRAHCTRTALKAPPKGHATKRGLDSWPGFFNSTGRLKAQNNAPSKMPGAHPMH